MLDLTFEIVWDTRCSAGGTRLQTLTRWRELPVSSHPILTVLHFMWQHQLPVPILAAVMGSHNEKICLKNVANYKKFPNRCPAQEEKPLKGSLKPEDLKTKTGMSKPQQPVQKHGPPLHGKPTGQKPSFQAPLHKQPQQK